MCEPSRSSRYRTSAKEEAGGSGAFLSFSGDADEGDPGVDLFAEAQEEEGEEEEEEEEGGDDGEPEDDFNAAWEVLEAARAKYEKQQGDNDEIKLKLAETYITLGDVSLETGESAFCASIHPLMWFCARREIRASYHRLQCRS